MSISSVLGSARLALQASQTAIETASHNIANANVDGYTRQRVDFVAATPQYTPSGAVGNGVLVSNVENVRDTLLDVNYRTQSAKSGAASTRRDLLTSVNDVFNEPADGALSSTLDQFWSSWSDLANNPSDTAAKSVVQQRGAEVASTLNRYAKGLDDTSSAARGQLDQQVSNINRYSTQIAEMNHQIVVQEVDGHPANDLRDQRNLLIDKLAAIVPVRTDEQKDGSVNVYTGSASLVSGIRATTASVQSNAPTISIKLGNQSIVAGGALGATVTVLNTDIPNAKSELDQLTAKIVSTVNTAHRTGWTAAGDGLGGANWNTATPPTGSNVDFFDAANTTAATISLSSLVKSSASYVAAGNVQNASGNNAVALQIAGLQSATTSITKVGGVGTTSFGDFYRDTVTRVGVAANDADSSATVYDTLVQQSETQRMSANGVSTDEELISLTKYQQAYSAAAKVITTAQDMSQTLLDMIR